MGSGCTTNNTTSGYFQSGISDKGVIYSGPSIPALNICHNDTLSEVEAVILDRIIKYSTGLGICIPNIDLTACDLFKNQITSCCVTDCNELDDLMKIIFDSLCILYTDFKALDTKYTDLTTGYVTGCLANVTTNSTLKQILQELLTEFCVLKSQVATLTTTVNTLSAGLNTTIGNFLNSAILSCNTQVSKTGTGASLQINFKGFTPLSGIIMYDGSLSLFDASGLGRPNTEMCGWALCNGNNGTPNFQGFVPVGTTTMLTTPDALGGTVPYNLNDTGGEVKHLLAPSESGTATHTHTVNEHGGHDHSFFFNRQQHVSLNGSSSNNAMDATGALIPGTSGNNTAGTNPFVAKVPSDVTAFISKSNTGITLDSFGTPALTAHENRMPYRAVYFIKRVA